MSNTLSNKQQKEYISINNWRNILERMREFYFSRKRGKNENGGNLKVKGNPRDVIVKSMSSAPAPLNGETFSDRISIDERNIGWS